MAGDMSIAGIDQPATDRFFATAKRLERLAVVFRRERDLGSTVAEAQDRIGKERAVAAGL